MLGAALALIAIVPAQALATSLPNTQDAYPWLVDGNVDALARAGNTVYLGGDFLYLGPKLHGLARLSAAGQPDLAFPTVDGFVRVVVPDGSGGWFVGGSFSKIGSVARSSLAHVLADGTIDPGFAVGVDSGTTTGEVLTLVRVGSTLYVGGAFTTVGGQPRSNLAAIDTSTQALIGTWAPDPDNSVLTLAAGGSSVYVGGSFSTIAGRPRAGLAAFDRGTGELDAWAPALSQPSVTALATSPTTLYVSGDFVQIAGATRTRLAAFDLATGALDAWAPTSDGPEAKLSYAAATDTIYLSGAAHWIANEFVNVIGLDAETGAAVTTLPWTGTYTTASAAGSTLYLASTFDEDPGPGMDIKTLVLGLDLLTGREVFRARMPSSFGSGAGEVRTIAVQGGDVVLGGWFESVGGADRHRLAAVDLTTGQATGWNPGADGTVRALAVDGLRVLAGGDFGTAGGATRSRIAALDRGDGSATAWNPNVTGGAVRALAVDGGTVYLGGLFTGVGGQPRAGVAAVDLARARSPRGRLKRPAVPCSRSLGATGRRSSAEASPLSAASRTLAWLPSTPTDRRSRAGAPHLALEVAARCARCSPTAASCSSAASSRS